MTVAPVETLAALAFDTSKRFVSSIDERDLVYFVLNVGDGDTQLILLPGFADRAPRHRDRLCDVEEAARADRGAGRRRAVNTAASRETAIRTCRRNPPA
jgi:hypothetical protein